MALGTRPHPNLELENKPSVASPHPDCDCQHHQPSPRAPSKTHVLGEIAPNRLHNLSTLSAIDSLAADLDKLHLRSPTKENFGDTANDQAHIQVHQHPLVPTPLVEDGQGGIVPLDLPRPSRQVSSETLESRSSSATFPPPPRTSPNLLPPPASRASVSVELEKQTVPPQEEQLEKLQAATRLEEGVPRIPAVPPATEDTDSMSTSETTVFQTTFEHKHGRASPPRTSEVIMTGKYDDIVEQIISLPPAQPSSRIEDSVEALDKLEEDLEALNAVAHLQVPDTKEKKKSATMDAPGAAGAPAATVLKRTDSGAKKASAKPARPTSLLPPKPPAKSSKPPTVPSFELPGEAVARRLKEQREARRSLQVSSEQAAALADCYSPAKPHVKSKKVPTRPTFELPGEAISRRKREEHAARLKAQEEEERRRREFKARPVRSSIAPSNFPRETIASRARQSRVFQSEHGVDAGSPDKGQSIVRSTSTRAAGSPGKISGSTAPGRGRASNQGSSSAAGLSRATSTSTGSNNGSTTGQRSTVGSEDSMQTRLRGKDIYNRDNKIHAERQRERREREEATKLARRQAAERSRQLSREWAEKQRMKSTALKMASPAATRAY